ncbi:MAG TPA: AMP-binding protein [Thermoanaerobaculia bacterium]|nr:AMP-binding protein [Thermoanaerobaculia bacterium]
MNLHDLFAVALARGAQRLALDFRGDGGGRWSYGELFAAAGRVAAELAGRGVGRGDRVALFLGNRPELVVSFLAVLRLGAVALPVNAGYRGRELGHILTDAEPQLLITESERRDVLEEAAEQRALPQILLADELAALCRADGGEPSGRLPSPGPDGSDLAMLLYTSGTTGHSKGAMLTHDNLLATITALLAAWGWRDDDVLLLSLPLFHTHGLVVGLATALAAGATVRLHPRFDAATVAAELAEEGTDAPTLFFGVPTMYVRLVDELAARPETARRLARVRLFASGSAPLAPETFIAFRDLTGHQILERYGMTETGMNLSNLYAGPRSPGSVGVPLPGVSARIVDEKGGDVEPGGVGELLFAGANVFAGYWREPAKTAASFVVDEAGRRWFRTGDLARRDPATGAYELLGRRHEMILCGGFNVYPREVEEVLASHPAVREAAVAGVPDRDRGEVAAAWIVLDADATAVGDDELSDYARARLAPFKVPRRWHRVEALPRNTLGKVQKHLLPR